jgi:hypothetical protein
MPYHEGQPIPPGYAQEERPIVALAIAGGVTMGALWLVSLAAGAALEQEARKEEERRDSTQYYYGSSGLGLVGPDDVVWPMALPVAGPFITIGTAHAEGAGVAVLLLDGILQTGGLACFIAGLAVKRTVLVLQPVGSAELRVSPTLGPTGAGFGINADL